MNLDDLKREQSYSIEAEPHKHGFVKGWNACIDYLASRGVIQQWQDIETAPEGKNVLVWYRNGVEIAWRYGRDWQIDTKKMQYHPTHWMPLPQPPKDTK